MKSAKFAKNFHNRAFILPSLITVAGLFAGYVSITLSIKGEYDQAVKYIALAFLFDGLDGRVARKLNAASPFGREFDSLCDLVAFGVAPAILVWEWIFRTHFNELGVFISFLFVAAGATRLARFNIRTTAEPKSYFEGLPVPAAAAGLASLVYAFPDVRDSYLIACIVLAFVVSLSLLMVSTLRFTSFKRLSLKEVDSRKVLLLFTVIVGLIWTFRPVIVLLLVLYILSAPYAYFTKKKSAMYSFSSDEKEGDSADSSEVSKE